MAKLLFFSSQPGEKRGRAESRQPLGLEQTAAPHSCERRGCWQAPEEWDRHYACCPGMGSSGQCLADRPRSHPTSVSPSQPGALAASQAREVLPCAPTEGDLMQWPLLLLIVLL